MVELPWVRTKGPVDPWQSCSGVRARGRTGRTRDPCHAVAELPWGLPSLVSGHLAPLRSRLTSGVPAELPPYSTTGSLPLRSRFLPPRLCDPSHLLPWQPCPLPARRQARGPAAPACSLRTRRAFVIRVNFCPDHLNLWLAVPSQTSCSHLGYRDGKLSSGTHITRVPQW